jgi:WhiB family transcriptional regulator, redox-sensing transcriptional regulator
MRDAPRKARRFRRARSSRSGSRRSPDDWASLAACRGMTATFFPAQGERTETRQAREETARRVCRSCPVLQECRNWARLHCEYGFWGGESEEDRARAGYFVELPVGRVARLIPSLRRLQPATGAEHGCVARRLPGNDRSG